jgi:hypothetical protein
MKNQTSEDSSPDAYRIEPDSELKAFSATKVAAVPYHDVRAPFTVDEHGAFAEYLVQEPELMPDLAIGAHVLISDNRKQGPFWLTGRVVGLKAISPFSPAKENLLYQHDYTIDPNTLLSLTTGPHTHQPMLIRVALDKELTLENDRFVEQAVQRPPSAISRLRTPDLLPTSAEFHEPSLRDILNVKSQGVSLGKIGFGNQPYQQDRDFLEYRLDLQGLDNKHIFAVGESGSGKTVWLKRLAYEIKKAYGTSRVIFIDLQGDLVQLLFPDITELVKPKPWQGESFARERVEKALKVFGDFQLIIPATKGGQPSENVVALMKLARVRGAVVPEIGLRLQDLAAPSDVEYMFRVASDQAAMLLDEEAEALVNQGEVASLSNLKSQIQRMLRNAANNQVTSSGGTVYYRTTADAALRAIRSLGNHFDFHQPSLSTKDNPLDAFEREGTTILFLEQLDTEERIMWEMQLVKWLYDNKRNLGETFVFVDEAHQIIPATPGAVGSKGTFERLRNNFERLAREGRKFGINLVLSTQNPEDLHPIVPEQCPTRVVMKINPKNAKAAFLDPELALIANVFGSGQFFVRSPFNGTANWVRVHSGAPPLPHEAMNTFWPKLLDAARRL